MEIIPSFVSNKPSPGDVDSGVVFKSTENVFSIAFSSDVEKFNETDRYRMQVPFHV